MRVPYLREFFLRLPEYLFGKPKRKPLQWLNLFWKVIVGAVVAVIFLLEITYNLTRM